MARTISNWLGWRKKVVERAITPSEFKDGLRALKDPSRTDITEFYGGFYNFSIPLIGIAFGEHIFFDSRYIDPATPLKGEGPRLYANSPEVIISHVEEFVASYESGVSYNSEFRHLMDKEDKDVKENLVIRCQIFEGRRNKKVYIDMATYTEDKNPYRGVNVNYTLRKTPTPKMVNSKAKQTALLTNS